MAAVSLPNWSSFRMRFNQQNTCAGPMCDAGEDNETNQYRQVTLSFRQQQMGPGSIAGTVIGIVVGLLLIAFLVFYFNLVLHPYRSFAGKMWREWGETLGIRKPNPYANKK